MAIIRQEVIEAARNLTLAQDAYQRYAGTDGDIHSTLRENAAAKYKILLDYANRAIIEELNVDIRRRMEGPRP